MEVTVWAAESRLVQITAVPTFAVSEAGWKAKLRRSMPCTAGTGVGVGVGGIGVGVGVTSSSATTVISPVMAGWMVQA